MINLSEISGFREPKIKPRKSEQANDNGEERNKLFGIFFFEISQTNLKPLKEHMIAKQKGIRGSAECT